MNAFVHFLRDPTLPNCTPLLRNWSRHPLLSAWWQCSDKAMEEFKGSLSERCSAVWWHAPWHNGIGAFNLVHARRTEECGWWRRRTPLRQSVLRFTQHIRVGRRRGVNHEVCQGEQGDPLLALFALGLYQVLVAVQAGLLPCERFLAFLDDIYVVCALERIADIHASLQVELWRHARISVHQGKTQLWNRAGVVPSGTEVLTAATRVEDEDVIVWRGDPELLEVEQGIRLLGHTVGTSGLHWGPVDQVDNISSRVVGADPTCQRLSSGMVDFSATRANCVEGGASPTCSHFRWTPRRRGVALRIWLDCSAWAVWVCECGSHQPSRTLGKLGRSLAQLSGSAEGPHLSGATVSRERLLGCQLRCPHVDPATQKETASQDTDGSFFRNGHPTGDGQVRDRWQEYHCLLSWCPLLASAGKQVGGSPSTSESVTWTCLHGVDRIRGDLKWSRTGCLCSMDLNSRLTPPWSLPWGGTAQPGPLCARVDGATLVRTPSFSGANGRLVVLACEVGGRWSEESMSFSSQLAKAKVRHEPPTIRASARHTWLRRWSSILACSASRSFASSLELRWAWRRRSVPHPRVLRWFTDDWFSGW